jgi:hypothetical protein
MKKRYIAAFAAIIAIVFFSAHNIVSAENTQQGLDALESQSYSPNTQQGLDALESQSGSPNTQQGLDALESQSGSSGSPNTQQGLDALESQSGSSGGGQGSANYSYSGSSGRFSIPDVGLPTPSRGILGIVSNLLYWLLAILSFVGIIGFVVSGIMYLVSTGDDGLIERAKKGMTASIIGVVVGLAGIVVIRAVYMALSGSYNF